MDTVSFHKLHWVQQLENKN